MICKTTTCDSYSVVLNPGCALGSLTKLFLKYATVLEPISNQLHQNFWGRNLGIPICFNSSLGESILWLGLRTTVLLLPTKWESLQWSSLLTTELYRGHIQTSWQMAAGQTPKQHETLQMSACHCVVQAICWAPGTSMSLPDHTSLLSRILLSWIVNNAFN